MTITASQMAPLPCPFCGNVGKVYTDVYYFVICKCGIKGLLGRTPYEAIENWNTRTPPTPTIDLAELDDAIYYLQDTNGIMQETDYFEYDKHQNLLIRTAKAYRALFTNQPKGDE